MVTAQVVAQAPARRRGVERGAVEDEADDLGTSGERAAEDLLALALCLGDDPSEDLVGVVEEQVQRDVQDGGELGSRGGHLLGDVHPPAPQGLLAVPVGLVDRVGLDAPAYDRSGDVERLGGDVGRRRVCGPTRDREEAAHIGAGAGTRLRRHRRIDAQGRGRAQDRRVHLGDEAVEVGLQAVGDLGHELERPHPPSVPVHMAKHKLQAIAYGRRVSRRRTF